ncbi:hypothetical protein pb186bvf_018241 [Paramecium bursaria]
MEPPFLEKEQNSHTNLHRLLKHYLAQLGLEYLHIQHYNYVIESLNLANNCGGQVAFKLTITSIFAYLIQLIYSLNCLYLILKQKRLICTQILVFLSVSLKVIAIVMTFMVKDRNWGECYITNAQGIILLCDQFLGLIILISLYWFTHKIFNKMKELDLLGKLQLETILRT